MKIFEGFNASMLRVSEQTSEVECSMYGNRTDTVEDLASPKPFVRAPEKNV
jgi:hypothetical protein